MHNCTKQSSKHVLLLLNDLDTLKYAHVHSTNSNQHLQPLDVHLDTSNALISKSQSTNQCPKHAPTHLQHITPQKIFKALNPLKIHSLTNQQANTQPQRHLNNTWSEMVTPTPYLFFYYIFPLWSMQWIGDISIPTFPQTIWIYCNLIHSYTSNIHHPMTMSNLMFYLQQLQCEQDKSAQSQRVYDGLRFICVNQLLHLLKSGPTY